MCGGLTISAPNNRGFIPAKYSTHLELSHSTDTLHTADLGPYVAQGRPRILHGSGQTQELTCYRAENRTLCGTGQTKDLTQYRADSGHYVVQNMIQGREQDLTWYRTETRTLHCTGQTPGSYTVHGIDQDLTW